MLMKHGPQGRSSSNDRDERGRVTMERDEGWLTAACEAPILDGGGWPRDTGALWGTWIVGSEC